MGVMALALPFGVLVAEVISGPAAAITMSQGWRPLVFSLALAGTAGLFASLLALPLCWQAGDRPGRFMEATCLAALTLPSPLFGIGVVLLWNRAGAATGALNLALPWIAHLGRFLPLAILIVASHLRQVDPLLWESARLAHAPGWAKALRVALPLALPGMVVAAGFTAALSLGEIGTTLLVCPPGYQTVSLRLYNLLHYGADASAAALALATTAVAATLGTGVWAMARRGWT